jgi:hypothetical protein
MSFLAFTARLKLSSRAIRAEFSGSLFKPCRHKTDFLGYFQTCLRDEYDRRSPRPRRSKLGNLKPPIRSKELNGKEETPNNDDSSAEP